MCPLSLIHLKFISKSHHPEDPKWSEELYLMDNGDYYGVLFKYVSMKAEYPIYLSPAREPEEVI